MLGRRLRSASSLVRGLSTSTRSCQPIRLQSSAPALGRPDSRQQPTICSGRPHGNIWGVRRYATDLPPHQKIRLPALSPTMEHGTILSWEKKVGDQVSEGDLLCEIETDKATMGFETPEEGYLAKILLPGGTKDVPIGKLLCIIVSDKDDVAKFSDYVPDEGEAQAAGAPAPAPAPAPSAKSAPAPSAAPPAAAPLAAAPPAAMPAPAGGRAFASPAAKQLAAAKGVDISLISSGSGMDGLITMKDVESFVASGAGQPAAAAQLPFIGGPMSGYSEIELTNMRKTIAKRLQASKLSIPHYYLTVDCEMDAVMKLRADLNKQHEKAGIKLSVNDFIIKATALASKRVPECNSAWMDTFIREHHSCDVCVAVDTGKGLITPIVTSADTKGLAEISASVKEMAGRAREGRLQPHEFQGGTITVSNLGMFGISHFTAIINPPQSCILAVGGTKPKVVPGPDMSFKTVNVMSVTLSCDHRVVDGAVGAQWLKHFKDFLEKPTSMLL